MYRKNGPKVKEQAKWKNDDIQLFGTDLQELIDEEQEKVTDPFTGVDSKHGITIWRIRDCKAVHWPTELYGQFYANDVFMVLYTTLEEGVRRSRSSGVRHDSFHIHVWVGKEASTNDYISGLYLATELDEALRYEAMLHRDVQGKESQRLLDYFNPLTIYKGSANDSYFNGRNSANAARLMKWYKPDRHQPNFKVKEVPTHQMSLNSENVMILDIGETIFLWIGNDAEETDIDSAYRYIMGLKSNRGSETQIKVVSEQNAEENFFNFYLKSGTMDTNGTVDSDDETSYRISRQATLNERKPSSSLLSVQSKAKGTSFKMIKQGKVNRKDLKGQNTALISSDDHVFLWVSHAAANDERKLAFEYAHEYLKTSERPLVPVTVIKEGQMTGEFERALAL